MSAHTPGPWEVGEDGDVIWGPEWKGRKIYVASVPFNKDPRTEADARLIAAAPDLLTFTEDMRQWLRETLDAKNSGLNSAERATAEAAYTYAGSVIAKATGEQP